jgi:hypothetical protein
MIWLVTLQRLRLRACFIVWRLVLPCFGCDSVAFRSSGGVNVEQQLTGRAVRQETASSSERVVFFMALRGDFVTGIVCTVSSLPPQ